ncbi:hypothetical protein BASA81_015477 [Batrachochytrium salamandrivorans]|nr:hypothetical protein BASA81_015477 [Batrachochytrium salamandrivorans]
MGVLNDARCYSACEVFSGAIQGHGAGTIFGEGKQTGGGGVVLELDPGLINTSPADLQKFPSSQQLTSGSTTYTNALSVGITQTIRIDRYSDRDIENLGIETDTIVRPCIDSFTEAFFTAPIGTNINIGLDVTLDTELGFDFLYLSVKSSGNAENFLLSSKSRDGTKTFNGISGRGMTVKGTFSFTTKSRKFSVSLMFTSDEGLGFIGATINTFTISAA